MYRRRVKRVRSYMFFCFFLVVVLNFPQQLTQGMRSLSISALTTPWNLIHHLRGRLLTKSESMGSQDAPSDVVLKLEEENVLLRSQVNSMRHWLISEGYLEKHLRYLLTLRNNVPPEDSDTIGQFLKVKTAQLAQRLEREVRSVPAQVIFREPSSWNSVLWIDVGEEANRLHNRIVIGKHSPVIVGGALVGIVENIREHCSSVRLITESRLAISVQALRGGEQDRYALESIEGLASVLEERENLFKDPNSRGVFLNALQELRKRFQTLSVENIVARGEIFGASQPLWRKRGNMLKGVGFFNPSVLDMATTSSQAPLKPGDLLVTTGIDGVFPQGFRVGTVVAIAPMREGDSAYEIEAKAMIENWENLSEVSVLPPREWGYEVP